MTPSADRKAAPTCPNCRALLPPGSPGAVVVCAVCHAQTRLPAPVAVTAAPLPPVVYSCPTCQARLRAEASAAGGKGRCPRCGQHLLIPQPQPVNPAVPGQAEPPPAPVGPPPLAPVEPAPTLPRQPPGKATVKLFLLVAALAVAAVAAHAFYLNVRLGRLEAEVKRLADSLPAEASGQRGPQPPAPDKAPARPTTAAGLRDAHVGGTPDDVRRLLGAPAQISPGKDGASWYYYPVVLDGGVKYNVDVEIDGGRVSSVVAYK
jgi:hypothetical protein